MEKGVILTMKIIKRLLLFILLLAFITGSCVFYAFKIEPYRLSLKEYTMHKENKNGEALKIIQFSDVHIKEDFTYENLATVVTKINEQNPDIVIFTGDLYDNYAMYNDDQQVIAELSRIEARYKKIAVWGNRDYGGGAMSAYDFIMEEAGFTLLKNENMFVSLEQDRTILFTGLDDSLLGNPTMPSMTGIQQTAYKILLSHEPDTVERFINYDYNLSLTGHSHGGQINVPFLSFINEWATTSTSLSTKYSGGMYDLHPHGIQKLFVNTGIGTTHISARFGVIPEISLFHIYI